MTVTANLYCALSAWSNRTYSIGECASASGNAYRCTTAGTTPTTPSGTSTTPVSFGAGTSKWVWLSAITFSGTTADAAFTAAVAGSTASGGLTGSVTQPIVWELWNLNGATWQTSAAGTPFLTLTGHSLTPTNNLTIRPALGEGFRDHSSVNALAFNAANGVSFTLPGATGAQNYFNITDPNVIFDGLQFKDPTSNSGSTIVNLNSGANNFTLRNCILDGFSQVGGADMFGMASGITGLRVTNSLFIDRQALNSNIPTVKDGPSAASTATFVNDTFVAINAQNAAAPIVSNGTGANSWVIRNCVSIGYANGILAFVNSGAGLADHCGTDATKVFNVNGGTDSGGQLVSQTVANMFVSSTTDFRLKAGSPFIDAGVTDTTNIPAADDIYRTSRPQSTAWDMGAHELALAFVASLSNTTATSENLSSVLTYAVTLADTGITTADALTFLAGYSASLSEATSSNSDNLTAALGFGQSLSDTVASSDANVLIAASISLPVDNVFTGDAYSAGANIAATSISDTVAATENLINVVQAPQADTALTSENLAGVGGSTATLSNTVASSDSITAAFGYSATLIDGLGPFSIDFSFDFQVVTTALETYSAVLNIASAFTATLSNTVASSDSLTNTITAASATFAETAASSDAIPFSAALALADAALTTSESYTATANPAAGISDTVASDSAVSFVSISLTLADGVGNGGIIGVSGIGSFQIGSSGSFVSADTYTFISGYNLGFTATVATSETLSVSAAALTVADTTATSENLTSAKAGAASLSDSAASSDSLALPSSSFSFTDTVATSENLSAVALAGSATVTATAASSESLTETTTAIASRGDSIASSDSVAFAGLATVLADSHASSDALSLGGLAGTLADTAATSENLTFQRSFFPALNETTATSESLTEITTATASRSDSAVSSDSFSGVLAPITATLSDSTATAEEYNLVIYLANVTDTTAASDSLSATAQAFPSVADSIANSDVYSSLTLLDFSVASETFTPATASLNSLLDLVATSEILVPVLGYQATLLDSVSTTDAVAIHNFGYSFTLTDTAVAAETWANLGISSPLLVIATVVPTGGAVVLQFPGYFPPSPRATELTLSRSVTGSGIWTPIYQGPPIGAFVDVGDGMAAPLSPTVHYTWQAVDYSGVTFTESLLPASSYSPQLDQLTQMLLRLLTGAINSLTLPPGMRRALPVIRMPTNGWQAMPFIVLNLDLIQQTEVEIGEDVINPTPDNVWTLFANAKRVWRVTIMSQDSEERDFYRDTLLAAFRVLKATVFAPMGLDVCHTFQAESYSNVSEPTGITPGFYAADLLLEIDGIFPTAVLTNYPVILEVGSNPTWLLNNFTETFGPTAMT